MKVTTLFTRRVKMFACMVLATVVATMSIAISSVQAATWNPTLLGGTTVAWYDAADANSLFTDAAGTANVSSNLDGVLRWNDKSGNGNHLVSGDVTPSAYTTGAMNGKSIVAVNNNFFSKTTGVNMGANTDNFAIIGVFQATSNNNWDNWIGLGNVAAGAPVVFLTSASRTFGASGGMEVGYDTNQGEATDVTVVGQPAFIFVSQANQSAAPDVLSVWMNGANHGSRNPSASPLTANSSTLQQIRIGHSSGNVRNPNGDIAELIVLNLGNGVLLDADRQTIEGYLAHKWWGAGNANLLAGDHPYKNVAPIPEPSLGVLTLLGLAAYGLRRRRRI